MTDYQNTSLWKGAFRNDAIRSEADRQARDDLLSAYRKLEDRIAPLLAKIPESCRELTIHDISHVHQLWSVASQVCGPAYDLNPLEGFVLGGAFLIHDAGLTASAYPGGIAALVSTDFYRDRVGALVRSGKDEEPSPDLLNNPPAWVQERALFDTLRAIHARQAERLLDNVSPHPSPVSLSHFFLTRTY